MWRCDEIVTFVPSSRKIITFLEVLNKLLWNLAASHRTWNVTKCDENVTSHHFVTVPHSNPGPGSGKKDASLYFFRWFGSIAQREIERRSATGAIACCRVWLPDTASSDTCACCIMLVCTHLLGSCHQQRKDKEICRCAECARTALIASYALATDF